MLILVVMKDSFELRCPSLQILQESQRFARAKIRGGEGALGRKEMETECNIGAAAKLKA